MSVLDGIVAQRRRRIAAGGHAMGASLPASRKEPPVPFGADPFLVCEIKRRSPSRGDIAPGLDAVAQARLYARYGVRNLSVLTEEDHFSGSLEDLTRVKEAIPGLSVLRKDFLLDAEDVEASWRAGADAVLLIASILDAGTLAAMYRKARSLGMQALVEVHDVGDIAKCRPIAPELTGINCRDLATMRVDPAHPFLLRRHIDWKTRLVFESGVRFPEDVRIAAGGGFSGVLVGEAAVRDPWAIPGLLAAVQAPTGGFWARLFDRKRGGRPLVKVCGITRAEDAGMAADLGADVLGFVFAPSRRRADPALLRGLACLPVLKTAVVVTGGDGAPPAMDPAVMGLIEDGLVDAVQFHGAEAPEDCAAMALPYYKALRLGGKEDVETIDRYRSPRVLCDAFVPGVAGGTGARIPEDLVRAAASLRPLWLAGGIGPGTVGDVLRSFRPELIDASSGLEESPGIKDRDKLSRFFQEIEAYEAV